MREILLICGVVLASVTVGTFAVNAVAQLFWVTGRGEPIVSESAYEFVCPAYTAETVPKARPASDFTR